LSDPARESTESSLQGSAFSGPLPVLYQDEVFVAVAKPAGMFVHRTEMDRRVRVVVMQTVRDQLKRPVYLVHRLDRPTSGIVLLALSSEAASLVSRLFRDRQVTKSYLAFVRGHAAETGRIDRSLTSPAVVRTAPLEAVTEYQTEQQFEIPLQSDRFPTTRCSLVRAIPRTGRYHQIRRHLNGINHPVIGDTSHGDSRQNRFFRENFGTTRLMLHAAKIGFRHPMTGKMIEVSCPMPPDMTEPLRQITTRSGAD